MPCLVSWRRSFKAMFVTIWMWTHEWSLISIRTTAFTFATCHQPLSWVSWLTRSITRRSFWLPRSGTRIRIAATASAGVRRVSRRASSETGCSMRSRVSGSSAMPGSIDSWATTGGSVITTEMSDHPVRLGLTDDLKRNRWTVFFRLILAIPHFIWFVFFSIGVFFVSIFAWFAALFTGRVPDGMHDFLGNYVRYVTHL